MAFSDNRIKNIWIIIIKKIISWIKRCRSGFIVLWSQGLFIICHWALLAGRNRFKQRSTLFSYKKKISPEFLCKSWSTFSTRNSLLLFESLYFGDQDWRKVFRPVAGHFGDRKGQWILKEDTVRFLQLYSHRNKYCRLSEYVRLKIYLGNTSECIYFAVVFTGRYLISISIHGFTPIVKYGLVSQEIEILPMFL